MAQRILLLDSNPGEGVLLKHHLDQIPAFRYEFEQRLNAQDGLERFAEFNPHLVFVNDLIEGMCPAKTVGQLRELGPSRPIVVLGNTRDADIAVRLIHAGADEYIRKGLLDPTRLQEVIEHAEARSIRRHVERDLHAKANHLSGMLERESLAMRELEVAMERVEAASQAKTTFLANVSHEIRTPLTAILGYADEILRDDLPAEERRESARIIRRNGDFLLRIVNDLLDLSKIEAGALELERVPFSPLQLLDDVERSFRPAARNQSITLSADVESAIPEAIVSDPTRVRQILVNLVGNALKFTQDGRVEIRMALRDDPDTAEPQLEFRVSDTGIGMTHEEIGRIFRPFTQADSSTTRRFGGTGLGLTISERLARQLGGRIDVKSVPEEGSTFTFRIAIGPAGDGRLLDLQEARSVLRAGPATRPAAQKLPTCHLLLAEDNPVNLKLVSRILERMGARVSSAATGVEAVEAVWRLKREEDPIDLILMDLQMPELDGMGAVARLREADWAGPIIALTGNAVEEERRRCLSSGFDAFTTKPIRRRELHSLLLEHLTRDAPEPDPEPEAPRESPS